MTKNTRNGYKMGGKHTTVIDAAEKVVDYLRSNGDVDKVVASRIKMGLKTSKHSMKIIHETGCLLLKVRGTASIQDIRVFSQNISTIQKAIENKFPQSKKTEAAHVQS